MLAIRAGRLFDGVSAATVERPVVIVEGARIIAVLAGGEPPAQAELVDLGDATLLPGLVDSHVHLVFDASPDPVGALAGADDEAVLAMMRTAAERALSAGITTVRDLGDRGYLAVRLREETARTGGPEILAAGPPITTGQGHCWFLGGAAATGADGVREAVRERAERGVDVIKLMATGGELTPGSASHLAQFEVDELRAAVDEARRHGLPTTAHAHGAGGIADAVAAGVDMIEHGTFMTVDGAEADAAIVRDIADAGIPIGATIAQKPRPGVTPPPRILKALPLIVAVFQQLRAAGIPLVCSSDAGIGPLKPIDSLPYGPAMMAKHLGMAPAEALRSVTSTAAQACRVGGRKGRVAPGYDADLLAVAGDPLADLAALTAVSAVFRGGVRVR
ncbi:amidohydrolase family protein [Dactylosporangium sp. AC04546]|uniref:amidohydrolase family protein n=1 Tax=Dactylosporangium sp. AC04546 TaxID=2862460 RepID=UPI001EE13439|nr:amidohydrolase family protein [Dactylosporangium sp. AC04546]WVK88284.1 amidohydrolase family protein [Dactylosporangium sp. AC04546]